MGTLKQYGWLGGFSHNQQYYCFGWMGWSHEKTTRFQVGGQGYTENNFEKPEFQLLRSHQTISSPRET